MAIISLPLIYHVSGKAPYSREPSKARVIEMVPIEIDEIAEYDAMDAMDLVVDGKTERLKFYKDRHWLPDVGSGDVSRIIREQAGFVSDYRLLPHLADKSLFTLLHYESGEPFEAPGKAPEISKFKTVVGDDRDVRLAELEKAARSSLLDIGGVVHIDVGMPFYRLRYTDRPLQVSVILGQAMMSKADRPADKRFDIMDISISAGDEIDFIVQDWEAETGKKADRIVEVVNYFTSDEPDTLGTVKTDLVSEAKAILKHDAETMQDWPDDRLSKWMELRQTVAAVSTENANDDQFDTLIEKLNEYEQFAPFSIFTKAVVKRWELKPIYINEIPLNN